MNRPPCISHHPRYHPVIDHLPLPELVPPATNAERFSRSVAERVENLTLAMLDRIPLLTWREPVNPHTHADSRRFQVVKVQE